MSGVFWSKNRFWGADGAARRPYRGAWTARGGDRAGTGQSKRIKILQNPHRTEQPSNARDAIDAKDA